MLYRVQLREEAARALRAANTLAGPNVWTARSLPTTAAACPMIQLQVLADTAESWGRNQPGFTRTAGLLVTARVAFKTDAVGTSSQGENLLDAFAEQIETTLMLDTALQRLVQQVSTIDTEMAFDSTGADQIATLRMRFDLEYPQTYEPIGEPLAAVNLQIANCAGITLAEATVTFPQIEGSNPCS